MHVSHLIACRIELGSLIIHYSCCLHDKWIVLGLVMVLSRLVYCSLCMILCTFKGVNRYNACPIANRAAMA